MRLCLMLPCCLVGCGTERVVEGVTAGDGHGPQRWEAAAGSSSSDPAPDAGVFSRGPADSGAARGEDCRGGVCPAGFYCGGSSACGSTWKCTEGFTPCSAAAPFLGCSCDGVFQMIAAGCPGEHAWRAELPVSYVGTLCDVHAPVSPATLSPLGVRYTGRTLTQFEGVAVRVRSFAAFETSPRAEASARVESGAFAFEWPALGDRTSPSFSVLTLFDANDDSVCDDADVVVSPSIANPYDLAAGSIELSLTPDDVDGLRAPCSRWNDH